MAVREVRNVLVAVTVAARPAFPLRHLPSTFQHPDVFHHVLAAAARPARAAVQADRDLRGVSATGAGTEGFGADGDGPGGAAGTALPVVSRGTSPAAGARRTDRARWLRELRVQPVLAHQLSRGG